MHTLRAYLQVEPPGPADYTGQTKTCSSIHDDHLDLLFCPSIHIRSRSVAPHPGVPLGLEPSLLFLHLAGGGFEFEGIGRVCPDDLCCQSAVS